MGGLELSKPNKKAAVSVSHSQAIQHWRQKQAERDQIVKVTTDAKPDGEAANYLFSRRQDLVVAK